MDDWSDFDLTPPLVSATPKRASAEYDMVTEWLRPKIYPARKLTIAIDGVEYSGKSSLARFLAWQLGLPNIETDFALTFSKEFPSHDSKLVSRLIRARHSQDRAVIVEGILVIETLANIGISPEILIRVERSGNGRTGSWPGRFREYAEKYPRSTSPDHLLKWDMER